MQPIKHISIPNPCRAEWTDMQPNSAGRHCLHCAKTVVDFSVMTDAEVITYLTTSSKACGRFGEAQLVRVNRLLEEKPKIRFSWKGLVAAASLLVLSQTGNAEEKNIVKTEQSPMAFKPLRDEMPADSLKTLTIRGKIVDKNDSLGLVGATIRVKGTETGTMTNVNGTFRLVTNNQCPTLVISYLGYATQEITVDAATDNAYIRMEATPMLLGEPAYVSYKKAPFYKRWLRKVKRIF